MDGRRILETWFRQVWIDGDFDAVDRMFPATTEATGLMDFAVRAEDIKAVVPAFRALVATPSLRIERVIESGDWISALVTFHGTAITTGRPVAVSGQLMVRVQGGVFTEAYNHMDLLGFFEKIGALPDNAVALALAGEPICP